MNHLDKFIQKQLDIASQLQDIVEDENITQRQLANDSGVDEPTISEIIRGLANPTLETIAKLESSLNRDLIVAPSFYKKDLKKDGYVLVNKKSLKNKLKLNYEEYWSSIAFNRKGLKAEVRESELSNPNENQVEVPYTNNSKISEAA